MSSYTSLYKSLPFLHMTIHVSECVILIAVLIYGGGLNFLLASNPDGKLYTTWQYVFEFGFYLSFVQTILTLLMCCCLTNFGFYGCFCSGSGDSVGTVCRRLFSTPYIQRFCSWNCNCPCYQTRPHLRFLFRFIYLFLCAILRIGTGIIYFTTEQYGADGSEKSMAIFCLAACIFLFLQFLLDYYHYRVLWHYRPSIDDLKEKFSRKHKRYLPYHLLGENRTNNIGNSPCSNTNYCPNRGLEHIMIFHATDYQPQPRWSDVRSYTDDNIYIGFHQTKPEYAVRIAHGDFMPSMNPPQMLGFGIYFARSLHNTFGKARNEGAFICAKIRMGKVKEITRRQLHEVKDSNAWWDEYDTVYLNNDDPNRDEFCIKDSSQIIKWVMAISSDYDDKVSQYGMEHEFDNTVLGCC